MASALDHAHQGVRANVVCTGFINTPIDVSQYEIPCGQGELDRSLASAGETDLL